MLLWFVSGPHAQAAAVMRRARLQAGAPVETEAELRQLADYDALLGIDGVA
ncbi:hypothetical protein ABGB12_22705 [Actinocorallia sp. B10E7]|uniref:hypothetical protein n=1 Tax=Actinocorallia sp. B10E7 TaxID=3153558 RepID=UPI00325D35BE